jgi:hypothetical protein
MTTATQERITEQSSWVFDDGGRGAAGFRGTAGDCGARAAAIATGRPYRDVYDALAALEATQGRPKSARNGVSKKTMRSYMDALGWEWTPTMKIGQGCRVHLRADELPPGRLLVNLSHHFAAVVDGTVRDTHDPTREGTRCVYGYWSLSTIAASSHANSAPARRPGSFAWKSSP